MRQRLQELMTHRVVHPARRMLGRLKGEYSPRIIEMQWPTHPARVDLLSTLATLKNVHSYLEIGCFQDECFARIPAARKVGVDPICGGTVRAKSDDFFATNGDTFDLIFIDGLHLAEQVLKDVEHSLAVLKPGGVIVVHDCLPLDSVAQYRARASRLWNGDVWKAFVEIRRWPHVDAATCLIDHGLGVVVQRPNTALLSVPVSSYRQLTFDHLADDYRRLLRTLDYEAAIEFAMAAPPTHHALHRIAQGHSDEASGDPQRPPHDARVEDAGTGSRGDAPSESGGHSRGFPADQPEVDARRGR